MESSASSARQLVPRFSQNELIRPAQDFDFLDMETKLLGQSLLLAIPGLKGPSLAHRRLLE
jgi:hypothetical protein